MNTGLIIATAVVVSTSFNPPEVKHFPGRFFDTKARPRLQQRAMERWPGPSQVVDLWRSGKLSTKSKAAVLLGMSASHDSVLLELYREAAVADEPRLRMAAAYGYRDLLGDALPAVSGGVDPELGRQLASEIAAVEKTLQSRSLAELWLQAALSAEGGSMPRWDGVTFERPLGTCAGALERVIDVEDFGDLTVAWRQAEGIQTKMVLMKLIEAITLQSFMDKPRDGKTGWGMQDVEEGLAATDDFVAWWLDRRCTVDSDVVLESSLSRLGVHGVRPNGPESWDVWLAILERGNPKWRMLAARRLYRLGGSWAELSVFRAEGPDQAQLIERLRSEYGLLQAPQSVRRPSPPAARPDKR